jgi:hypothetical protein
MYYATATTIQQKWQNKYLTAIMTWTRSIA